MTDVVAQDTTYGWMELAALLANGQMVRVHYVRVSDSNAIAAWAERFDHTDVFASVGSFMVPNNNAVLPDGIRHRTYLSLARFYRWIGMHPDEIHEQIVDLDRRNPIRDPDAIDRIVAWSCAHPGFPGCQDESLRRYCRPENCFYSRLKDAKAGNIPETKACGSQ